MNDTHVHVQRNFLYAGGPLEFFVWRKSGRDTLILRPRAISESTGFSALEEWVVVPEGEHAPGPSFSIEPEIWAAMLSAAAGQVEAEPESAMERHLTDALGFRDRVMSLLERELDRTPTIVTEEKR